MRITSFYDDDDHVTEIVIIRMAEKASSWWSQDKQDVGAAGQDIHHSVLS